MALELNPKKYCSAEQLDHLDYTRTFVADLERVVR